jgi:hypothetical protein
VERNPKLIGDLHTFILDFQSVKPGVFEFFQGGSANTFFPLKPESDRGVALLLCYCALYQNISEKKLVRFLAYLWEAYGTDLFKLNRMPFQALQDKVHAFEGLENWELMPKVPGILRSVCDFFYKRGPLIAWVHKTADAEESVQVLSEEIFFMGKTSQFKSKPRYFLWLLTQLPGAQPELFWTDRMLLPITAGHVRLLRDFGPLKKKRNSPWTTPAEKLNYCNRFYRMLFPGKSWMVYTALDAYLKATGPFLSPAASTLAPATPGMSPNKIWRCRQVLGGCINCILAPECQGRDEL